jgi:hypothetical protein
MKFKFASVMALGAIVAPMVMSACSPLPPLGQAYWQRVEDNSALYMTGPKAQQRLDGDIATCVRIVDELVELDATREVLPPDTHSDYHNALKSTGDLSYYDSPTRHGDKKVDHVDYHDFEGCMRSKGWERVRYIRYQTLTKAQKTYTETQQFRKTGLIGAAAEAKAREEAGQQGDFSELNQ